MATRIAVGDARDKLRLNPLCIHQLLRHVGSLLDVARLPRRSKRDR